MYVVDVPPSRPEQNPRRRRSTKVWRSTGGRAASRGHLPRKWRPACSSGGPTRRRGPWICIGRARMNSRQLDYEWHLAIELDDERDRRVQLRTQANLAGEAAPGPPRRVCLHQSSPSVKASTPGMGPWRAQPTPQRVDAGGPGAMRQVGRLRSPASFSHSLTATFLVALAALGLALKTRPQ